MPRIWINIQNLDNEYIKKEITIKKSLMIFIFAYLSLNNPKLIENFVMLCY